MRQAKKKKNEYESVSKLFIQRVECNMYLKFFFLLNFFLLKILNIFFPSVLYNKTNTENKNKKRTKIHTNLEDGCQLWCQSQNLFTRI